MLGEKVEPEVPLGVPSTITALGPSASVRQRVETICSCDARAGWPASKPGVGVSHDTTWCLAQHQMTLAHHLSESTQCVVELGAWLGKFALCRQILHVLIALVDSGNTTRFITQHAPNAVVFAVDQWANDALLLDPHYDGEEHQRVLKDPPLYDSFIANTWELRGSMQADDQ
eukprot:COSAG04_NODE_13347_length_610_cov_0.547945_1_plen_171_part_10